MVPNQSPVYAGHNTFSNDPLLMLATSGLNAELKKGLSDLGKWAGAAEVHDLARLAETNAPILKSYDANGNRIDQIEFHPSYHAFMRKSVSLGLQASIWEQGEEEKGNRNAIRAARMFITAGAEAAHLTSISITNASIAALLASPPIAQEWLALIASRKYDSSNKMPGSKSGVTLGLAISEKQNGNDFKGLETKAESSSDGTWQINGHKWFVSAPMSDAFLMVALTGKGPTCFLMPRILSNGSSNGIRIQRLKNNLGGRSCAVGEFELENSIAQMVGEEGQATNALAHMTELVALDSTVITTSIMRASLGEAVHHCRHRQTNGAALIDQPLMQRVLADMALDVAASTVLSFRLAQSYDRGSANPAEAAYRQLMTPIIKYWLAKLAPTLIAEAMECVGGNAYSDESNLARNYRQAPLDGLFHSGGNVVALHTLSKITQNPQLLNTVLEALQSDLGGDGASKTINVIQTAASMATSDSGSARILVEQLALTAAAAELKRIGLTDLADAFIETRLGGLWRSSYGMLDTRQDASALLNALYPMK